MTLIKKYGNRRLYDTGLSRYITLEELAGQVRDGADVRVVDAKSGSDLTQATLAQIILESRGGSRLLPVPLLVQLIRMGDEALAEFFGRYVSGALELYLQAKAGAQAFAPMNPFATLPFTATNALARLFGSGGQSQQPMPMAPSDDVASLRRELDELRREMRPSKKKPAEKKSRSRRAR